MAPGPVGVVLDFIFCLTKFYIYSVYMSKLFIFILSFSLRYSLFNYVYVFLSGFSSGFSSIKSLTFIRPVLFKVFMALGPSGISKTKYKMGTCFSSSKYLLNMSVKT